MTLKKPIESTIDASNPSWTTRWITSIGGWWRFSRKATRTLSASIPTPVLRARSEAEAPSLDASYVAAVASRLRVSRRIAIVLAVCLLAGSIGALSQTHQKKKKSSKPKPVPCRTGCAPDTAAPEITTASPDDEVVQRELSTLARALHNATPGAYEKLSAFAKSNAGNVWGARAALALGSDDYNKNHAQQALAWLVKAKSDTLLSDYVLYWTALTQRTLRRNAEALANLEAIEHDHPGTAMKEQLLEALGPAAIETGHPQLAVEALEAYPSTFVKPALLLERAQAYKAARQTVLAAKAYQTLFSKYPLPAKAKPAGTARPHLPRSLAKENPNPAADLQDNRTQPF